MVRAICALAWLGRACSDSPLPGKVLGTYQVVAQTKDNSCGLMAPNPWQFDVQLSRAGDTLYWSWMDGTPPLSGSLDAQLQATLATTQTANVDGSEAGLGPCDMQRDDTLQIALDSASPPGVVHGTIAYSFSVPNGYTCADQLAPSGAYQELPCSLTYTVTGSRQ